MNNATKRVSRAAVVLTLELSLVALATLIQSSVSATTSAAVTSTAVAHVHKVSYVHTRSLPYAKITATPNDPPTIGSPDGPAYTVVSNAYGVIRFCDKHNLVYIASPSLSAFYNSMPETGSGYWGMTNVMQMQVLKNAC